MRSNAGLKKISGRASVLSPFEQLAQASTSALVRGGSVMLLSASEASESLVNNESGNEVFVSVDSWLGGRFIATENS